MKDPKRRAVIVIFVLLMWLTMMWAVWGFPSAHTLPSGNPLTRYGVVPWRQVNEFGHASVRRMGLAFATLASVLGSAVIFLWVPRRLDDDLPRHYPPQRGKCRQCGYLLSHAKSDRCPECGWPTGWRRL
ncbi:MAG: hypothetical protein ACYTE6_05405 [Planctomycetota bacterium]|jgi:hypothetical protein